jgi:hypothetical protein
METEDAAWLDHYSTRCVEEEAGLRAMRYRRCGGAGGGEAVVRCGHVPVEGES